ncbi:MAG: hypothetical protein C0502_03320 [Opitutus sp.]|nr:hypothetical protein [Opitutus sp.]
MRGIRHPSPESRRRASRQTPRRGGVDASAPADMLAAMNPRTVLPLSVLLAAVALNAAEAPKITAFERSQGWQLLFDGRDLSSWRGYRSDKVPANWRVADGSLTGAAGAALVTAAEFGDFELTFDWRVGEGGHGEVFVRTSEDAASPDRSGPQMQLAGHGPALGGHGLAAPERTIPPQFGVWYRSKIVAFGNRVEHWINGERVHAYSVDTPEWRKLVAASPLAGARDLGRQRAGFIALSGDRVEFRNLKVRPL